MGTEMSSSLSWRPACKLQANKRYIVRCCLNHPPKKKFISTIYAYNLSIWEMETGRTKTESLGLYSKFKVNLGYSETLSQQRPGLWDGCSRAPQVQREAPSPLQYYLLHPPLEPRLAIHQRRLNRAPPYQYNIKQMQMDSQSNIQPGFIYWF